MTRDQNRLARDRKSFEDHLKRFAIQTSEVKMAANVLERLKSRVISVRAGIARSASRTRRARLRSGAREPVVILRILASFGDQESLTKPPVALRRIRYATLRSSERRISKAERRRKARERR